MYITVIPSWRQIGAMFLSIFMFVPTAPVRAESLLLFDFENDAGDFENMPDQVAAHLTVSGWTDLDGTLTNFAGNPGKALAARSFDDGNTLALTIEVEPGFRMNLNSYSFDQRASSQGPMNWSLAVDSATIASGPTSLDFTTVAAESLLAGMGGAVTVTVSGTDGATSSGTFRVDNFSLSGQITAVPLPPSLLLLLGSTSVLLSATRRKT